MGTEAASCRIAKSGRRVTSGDRLGSEATVPTCRLTTPESWVELQKYRDEVENDRKPWGEIVIARVCVRNLPSSASRGHLCRPRPTRGRAASVSRVDARSSGRFRGLGGAGRSVRAEPGLQGVRSRPGLIKARAVRSVRENGTLPGIMAGKRPPPSPIRSNQGFFFSALGVAE